MRPLGTLLVAREAVPGGVKLPCTHPPYALTYKQASSLPDHIVRENPLGHGEDYVYCERCWGVLIARPEGS
jgi:hypothetical protein